MQTACQLTLHQSHYALTVSTSSSDLPFPPSVGALASREDSQRYLQAYIDKYDLRITHSTLIKSAHYNSADKNWEVTVSQNAGPDRIETFDALFVCTGIFSEPLVPPFGGRDDFEAAGGKLLHSTQVGENVDLCKGNDVVVLGFGRSSCDIAAALAREWTCRSIVGAHGGVFTTLLMLRTDPRLQTNALEMASVYLRSAVRHCSRQSLDVVS